MSKHYDDGVEQGAQNGSENFSESKILKGAPFQMMFAEGYTLGFMRMFDENREKMSETLKAWQKPVLDASEMQFVKNLVNYDMLTPKIDNNRIILSYIEIIYTEMLRIIIEFGADLDIISSLKFLFDQQYRNDFTTSYSPLAEILFSGHDGLEVEFAYDARGKEITAYDYLFAPLFLARSKSMTMQFSLIPILNKVREIFKNSEPIKIRHSMYDGFRDMPIENTLTKAELRTVEQMRCLKEDQTLSLKVKANESDRYIMSVCSDDTDKSLASDLKEIFKKHHISDFSDLNVKTRNGGIANVKISEQEII